MPKDIKQPVDHSRSADPQQDILMRPPLEIKEDVAENVWHGENQRMMPKRPHQVQTKQTAHRPGHAAAGTRHIKQPQEHTADAGFFQHRDRHGKIGDQPQQKQKLPYPWLMESLTHNRFSLAYI